MIYDIAITKINKYMVYIDAQHMTCLGSKTFCSTLLDIVPEGLQIKLTNDTLTGEKKVYLHVSQRFIDPTQWGNEGSGEKTSIRRKNKLLQER